MITLVQKAVRYAVGGSSSDQFEETVSCRPKLEDFVSMTDSVPETKEFEGLVTSIDSSCIVIDQYVYCEPSDFPGSRKAVGVRVRGVAQRGGRHEMWRAKTVRLVLEEWDAGPHYREKDDGDGTRSRMHAAANNREAILCRDLAEGIPGILKSDVLSSVSSRPRQPGCSSESSKASARTGSPRTVIGKVTGIYGDTVTLNDSICCSLSSASGNVDLLAGDWVVCEVDENSSVGDEARQLLGSLQVSSYKPLRRKRVRGEVTHSYQTHFIVNEEIFCSRGIGGASLCKTGDTMTVEVVESQHGNLCWRAVSVASAAAAPSTQGPGTPPSLVQLGPVPKVDVGKNRIFEDQGDIVITQTIRFPPVVFETAAFTDVSIRNTGPRPRTLRRVSFVYASQESQFSVTSCSGGGLVDGTARTLRAGAEVVVRLCCAGTLIGSFRQLCIFEFETFHIGRHVIATVEDPLMASLAPASCYTSRSRCHTLTAPKERGIVVGQKSFRPSPFIPVKLPPARVPERLWHEVNRGDLFNVTSVLREPLNADNHKEKFTLLLHLEEIKMTQQMREFDMARASFAVCGEFLSLTVPGLAEKRPSLMIGDSVIATDLCRPEEVEYEGCIHQVLNSQILLKFHHSFHNGYHGEDYRVRFNFNRTPLRRCHFALGYTVRQLGQDVLFPSRLKIQLPQVCYIDPEVQELTRQWKQCPSSSYQLPSVVKDTNKPRADVPEWQPWKPPVVTRLFGVPPRDVNSLNRCSGAHKVVASGTKLIPRQVDEAVRESAKRGKPLHNNDAVFEGKETLHNKKPVMEKGVSNCTLGNHQLINKEDKSLVTDSPEWMKEQHVRREVFGNAQYKHSRVKPSKKLGCEAAGSTLLNKTCYVVPVLPCGPSKKKMQHLEKLPVLKWFNGSLNREQKLAVRRILEGTTRPLPYVVFGPPGTGKTVTLVEAALQIMTLIAHSRLLIVTPSNSASDLVTERLVESGRLRTSDVVRLIAYQRSEDSIPEVIRPYCCNGEELEVRAHQRVVVATATCAGVLYMQGLHREHFTHVLVDEAGQLTEPECLVPLGLVNRVTGQVVLAGDPKQLGPVVQSALARQGGLQRSLLQRLCQAVLYQSQEGNEGSVCEYEPSLVTQLVRNYRSHPHILAVPSRLFYNNTLQACADIKALEHLLTWKELPCDSCPILFHGVVGTNLREGDSPSWFNPAEAFQVVRYTKSLLLHGLEERDIGIITPYRKQVEKLHKLLATFGIEGVKVGSVEEFQGQERKVILISTVRSSSGWIEEDAKYSLGFIKCNKRFNVAITRSQGLLVIVGNPLVLSLDDSWKELIRFCLEKGSYRGPELEEI